MWEIRGLLVDLDGTIYEGDSLIPGVEGAVTALRERSVPLLFATNTSRKCRRAVAASLRDMGLAAAETEIYTAPVAAARWLSDRGIRRIQLLVPESTHEDFQGFEFVDDLPEAVLVGDLGDAFTFERLNMAFRSIQRGARLVAIHRNRFWLPAGEPTLDAGPFVAALEYATGRRATLVGKPAGAFFETAASLLEIEPRHLAVVGDDPESDIKGGRAAGLTTLQVRTGKFDASRLEAAPPAERPHLLLGSFADVVDVLV